ncbi:hypothetical protein Esti_006319 [Eimeria stiedai]
MNHAERLSAASAASVGGDPAAGAPLPSGLKASAAAGAAHMGRQQKRALRGGEELPQIASAAPRLWRMLLQGDLLQPASSLRLHSGRAWVGMGCCSSEWASRGPSVGAPKGPRSSCCSVLLQLLSVKVGRLRRLSLSRRVLEPVPAASLLFALRGQSSSLEELLIASADCSTEAACSSCSSSNSSSSSNRQEFVFPAEASLSGALAQAAPGTAPFSCRLLQQQQQQHRGIVAAEAPCVGGLQDSRVRLGAGDVEALSSILSGVVFPRLQRLRVQGCQAFLWLQVLNKCCFPSCLELTVACACIQQHTVPPPHGAERVACDLLSLTRSMEALRCLHLEVALPPTRKFWRFLFFPEEERQPPTRIQQLRVSEAVFLNVVDVLAEARRSGGGTGGAHGGALSLGSRCYPFQEIRVLATQLRLHPEIMFWRLSDSCWGGGAPGPCRSVCSDFVLAHVGPPSSSPSLLRAVQHAKHLRLVFGSGGQTAAAQQQLLDRLSSAAAAAAAAATATTAAAATRQQTLGCAAAPNQLLQVAIQQQLQQQQQQQQALLAALVAEARATAAAAVRLCREAFAAREYSLDIRDDNHVLFNLQQAARTLGQHLCHMNLTQLLETEQQQQQQQVPHPLHQAQLAASNREHAALSDNEALIPSVRVVGWPTCMRLCMLQGKQVAQGGTALLGSSADVACCAFCGCLNGRTSATSANPKDSSNSSSGMCVCFAIQVRAMPFLYLLSSFLLGHSGGGSSPRYAAALLQSDVLLLLQVCNSALLRPRCVGLDVDVAEQTPLQRKSTSVFLNALTALPAEARPPLRLLRLSLPPDLRNVACAGEDARLSSRVLQMLLTVLQQYPRMQRVEVSPSQYLRDPAEEPQAAFTPTPLLQLQQLLLQHGFEGCQCKSSSALRHVYVFTKAAADAPFAAA